MRKSWNETVDTWAIGCIAYELYTGIPPFYDKSREITMKNILESSYDK